MAKQNSHDNYWRLEAPSQTKKDMYRKCWEAGYRNININWSTEDLAKYVLRVEQNRMCYENCSGEELIKFADTRSISFNFLEALIESSRATIRGIAVHRLVEADESPRFAKFLDLPPELRNRIYKFYDNYLDDYLINPTKPLLARTCHQLNKDVLPIFYSRHEFEINLARLGKSVAAAKGDVPGFREQQDTQFFLSTLTDDDVANIKRLTMLVSDKRNGGTSSGTYGVAGTMRIWLLKEGDLTFTIQGKKGSFVTTWKGESRKVLEAEFRKALEKLPFDEGKNMSFTVQGLHDPRLAVGAAYRQVEK